MSNFNSRNLDSLQYSILTRNPSGDLSPSGRKNLLYQKPRSSGEDENDIEINNLTMSNNFNGFPNNNDKLPASPSSQFGSFFSQNSSNNNLNFNNQMNNYTSSGSRSGHITPPISAANQNQNSFLSQLSGSGSPNRQNSINQFAYRNSNSQLSNLIQQQKKVPSANNLTFNGLNTLNSTIARPQSANNTDSSAFSPLDQSDFPVLTRNQSPFSQQRQTILNNFHNSNSSSQTNLNSTSLSNTNNTNGPLSAPILSSQQQLNLQNFNTNSLYSQLQQQYQQQFNSSNNQINLNNNTSNINLNNSNSTLNNLNTNSNQGKMWSSFGSFKDTNSSIKNNPSESAHEFQIQQEDFPALPRSQNTPSVDSNDPKMFPPGTENSANKSNINTPIKKGIQVQPDGRMKNVPPNMLLDQFGMVGLLAYIKADRDKDYCTLALGNDLTALGLNLNSAENLYHSFLSPFSDIQCRLQDIDFQVPTEYIVNSQIKDKLPQIDLNRYNEDLLFYLFYMNGGDSIQLHAATVLYERDWRYHTEKRVWLTKPHGIDPQQKTQIFEKGVYIVFDVSQWKKIQMEMTVEYNKLAEKPTLNYPYQRPL